MMFHKMVSRCAVLSMLAVTHAWGADTLIEVGTQSSESHAHRMVVAVEHTSRNGQLERWYYSVSLEAALSPEDEQVSVDLDVRPFNLGGGLLGGELRSLRTQFRRDVDLGSDGALTVHAVGLEIEDGPGKENALEPGTVGLSIDALDFRLAVDLIGLSYMNGTEEGQEFLGLSIFDVEGEIGGNADVRFNPALAMRIEAVYIGGQYGVAGGSSTAFGESEVYSSLSAILQTLYGDYGVFVKTGTRASFMPENERSYKYLKVGISGRW